MHAKLFTPLRLRTLEFKNRVFVSPMCQYSSVDGAPTDWHLVHLGSRAVGGAGCIIQEATAVTAEGRISPGDAGIWNDAQAEAYKRITRFITENGSIPAIQLAHAGRKASTALPWDGNYYLDEMQNGWRPLLAPSPIKFEAKAPEPKELTLSEITALTDAFCHAARRSLTAGFEIIELHAAHGYLLHEFLSPLANQRKDKYGGSLENRMRLVLEVAAVLRKVWPEDKPVFVRISATDWVEGGWDIEQSVELAKQLKIIGIDLIDVSTGGMTPDAKIPVGPGFQVPFAERIRREVGIATGAVGMISTAAQAEHIITSGHADVILMARTFLRDPYWPLHAAEELNADTLWVKQYQRAKLHKK